MRWIVSRLAFDGRAGRKEYGIFFAVTVILFLLAATPDVINLFAAAPDYRLGIPAATRAITIPRGVIVAAAIVALALYVMWIPLCVRRLHDIGRSGWFTLLCAAVALVPYLGYLLVSLVLMSWPGEEGPNIYGADPRRPGFQAAADVFGDGGG